MPDGSPESGEKLEFKSRLGCGRFAFSGISVSLGVTTTTIVPSLLILKVALSLGVFRNRN
jgi:hypothetical protein